MSSRIPQISKSPSRDRTLNISHLLVLSHLFLNFFYLGSEIIPVNCIYSRRNRPKISEMFCRQQELQRQQQNHNSNDYQQYNEYSRRYQGPTSADWSNQASNAQSSGWGYASASNNNNIAPPGLMRGGAM